MDTLGSSERERYCRDIEAYLCRKNDGHLIRIVGPAFDQVCGWADRGVPLKVAFAGIDRFFERYYSKGPRRRPVRVEFCEADVLDAFDEWRRAVGVTEPLADSGAAGEDSRPRRGSLASHLERAIARLTSLRAGSDPALDGVVDAAVRELDAALASARGLRGEARRATVERLRSLDAELLKAARGSCGADTLSRLEAEADDELGTFRDRLEPDAYRRAKQASVDRLLRERLRLPTIAYDG